MQTGAERVVEDAVRGKVKLRCTRCQRAREDVLIGIGICRSCAEFLKTNGYVEDLTGLSKFGLNSPTEADE